MVSWVVPLVLARSTRLLVSPEHGRSNIVVGLDRHSPTEHVVFGSVTEPTSWNDLIT